MVSYGLTMVNYQEIGLGMVVVIGSLFTAKPGGEAYILTNNSAISQMGIEPANRLGLVWCICDSYRYS